MAKVFVAVIPDSEAERLVVEALSGYEPHVALGDIFGYTANFYSTKPLSNEEADGLARKIASKEHEVYGLCRVTKAPDTYPMDDFMTRCLATR